MFFIFIFGIALGIGLRLLYESWMDHCLNDDDCIEIIDDGEDDYIYDIDDDYLDEED